MEDMRGNLRPARPLFIEDDRSSRGNPTVSAESHRVTELTHGNIRGTHGRATDADEVGVFGHEEESGVPRVVAESIKRLMGQREEFARRKVRQGMC